jgi:hypothetical protein
MDIYVRHIPMVRGHTTSIIRIHIIHTPSARKKLPTLARLLVHSRRRRRRRRHQNGARGDRVQSQHIP